MRNILTVAFITVMAIQAFADKYTVRAGPPSRINTDVLIQDDRFVPFPWSTQRPFPWGILEGTWLAQNGDFESYFSFHIIPVSEATRRLEIKQIDLVSCKAVASGYGVMAKPNKTMNAFMQYLDYDQDYGLMVRSFLYGGPIRDIFVNPIEGQVVVLSIKPTGRNSYVHMVLTKVSSDINGNFCRTKARESKERHQSSQSW